MAVFLGILFGVLFVAALLVCVVLFFIEDSETKGARIGRWVSGLSFVAFLALFVFIPFGFKQVQTGEIAVVKVWGEAQTTKGAGLQFRNIISTKFVIYDVKTQQLDIENPVYTKDAQSCDTQLLVQYRLNPDQVLKIAAEYGTADVHASRITRVAREKTEVILTSYTAMELIEQRGNLSPAIMAEMKQLQDQYYITIENVVLVDLAFSDAFENAVEQKMMEQVAVEKQKAEAEKAEILAKQNATVAKIKAENDLEVAKLNAQKALESAKGEANALLAIAEGEAKALKVKTIEVARMLGFDITSDIVNIDGEDFIEYNIDFAGKSADEIELISAYVKYIAWLESWNGVLPEVLVTDDISIIIPVKP